MDILFEQFPTLDEHSPIEESSLEKIMNYITFLQSNSIILAIEDAYQQSPTFQTLTFEFHSFDQSITVSALDINYKVIKINDFLLNECIMSILSNQDIDSFEQSLCEIGLASIEKLTRDSRFNYYSQIMSESLPSNYSDISAKYIQNWDQTQSVKQHTFGKSKFPEFFYNFDDIPTHKENVITLIQQIKNYNLKANIIEWFKFFNEHKDVDCVYFNIFNKESIIYTIQEKPFLIKDNQPLSFTDLAHVRERLYQYPPLHKELPYEDLNSLNSINKHKAFLKEDEHYLFLGALRAEHEKKVISKSILNNSDLSFEFHNKNKKRL